MSEKKEERADNPDELRFQIIKALLDEFPELRGRVEKYLRTMRRNAYKKSSILLD